MLSELLKIAILVLGSLGGGGVIVLGLSNWLGRVWADRLMQKERASYERDIEEFKARALQSLEEEKAVYQRALEKFKADLGRENELAIQTLRERVALYKETLASILDLYMLFGAQRGKVGIAEVQEFEKKRLVTSATLGIRTNTCFQCLQ